MNPSTYRSLVFDCDGVILNSNPIKTQAFHEAALPYGERAAAALVDFHQANGGVSRYAKFRYFLQEVVSAQVEETELTQLLRRYGNIVRRELGKCEVAEGLRELRERCENSRWLMVSGGDQHELRGVFAEKQLDQLFDGGIFGSPDTKNQILARERARGNLEFPAVFIGDSRYDYEASSEEGLDFVFVTQWTEFSDYRSYFRSRQVYIIRSLEDLIQ